MSWIRRETEKETVQYICPHCHDYHEFREDFGERTFSENYIFCRRCGARNGTGNAPTLTPPNEPLISGFDVIDTKTGEYPDLWEIALKEDWANGLMYCDMEGFAIEEDGTLLLLDECGKHAYCPEGRFKIVPRPPEGGEDAE